MSDHRIARFGIAAVVVVLLLGAGAAAIQQAAWSQGYMMGLIAGNGEGDALTQYVLFSGGRIPSLMGGIGGLFKAGLLLFGFLFVAKFVFGMAHLRRWQMAGGPENGWQGHHHGSPWRRPEDASAANRPGQGQAPVSESENNPES